MYPNNTLLNKRYLLTVKCNNLKVECMRELLECVERESRKANFLNKQLVIAVEEDDKPSFDYYSNLLSRLQTAPLPDYMDFHEAQIDALEREIEACGELKMQ